MDSTPEGSDGEYNLDQDDQLQPEDTLEDLGVDDVLDQGFSPPERPLGLDKHGLTDYEQRTGESLDERLDEEVPDVGLSSDYQDPLRVSAAEDGEVPRDADDELGDDRGDVAGDREFAEDYEVGDARSGRLVAEDEGVAPDTEADLVAGDVGIDGAAASAEEAAVHTVDDEDEDALGTAPGDEDYS